MKEIYISHDNSQCHHNPLHYSGLPRKLNIKGYGEVTIDIKQHTTLLPDPTGVEGQERSKRIFHTFACKIYSHIIVIIIHR